MTKEKLEEYKTKNGITIEYNPELNEIINVKTKDKNLTIDLQLSWYYGDYHSFLSHLYDCREYNEDIRNKMFTMFDISFILKNEKREDLSCMMCSHVFSLLKPYTEFLRLSHFYFNIIVFWEHILNILLEWEKERDHKIHRGSIYGFLGSTYAFIQDSETAFSYFHRAVQEDDKIKEHLKGYPKEAPGYKIVTLNKNTSHFMNDFVNGVRDFLEIEIEIFARTFPNYKDFTMIEFDRIFIDQRFFDNGDFYENIKINVSYYIWHTVYYNNKVDRSAKSSSFDNLNRLHRLAGMCLMIESIVKELNPTINKMKERISKLYTHIGGKNDFDKLYNSVKNKNDVAEVNKLIKSLLDLTQFTFENESIDDIDRCILLHSLVRNFTAHNLKSVEIIGDRFFDIARILLFTFFMFLIEFDKKGYKM